MPKATSKPSQLSEEFVRQSSDEEDEVLSGAEGHDANGQTATNGNGSSEAESSEAESSSSESESTQEESATESEQSSRGKKRSSETATSHKTQIAKRPKKSFRIPAQAFKAPIGFERLSVDTANSNTGEFDNLDGKQVWHISAPASVDLALIKELDVGAALRGDSILTTNGVSYGMQPSSEQAEVLLLPSGNPVTYGQKANVNRAFRLRQVANGGNNPLSKSTSEAEQPDGLHFTAQVPGKKKEPRKQPQTLNYRYAPFGVDQPISDTTDTTQLAESILLKAASQRSDASGGAGEVVEPVEKKRKEKKKKRPKPADETTI